MAHVSETQGIKRRRPKERRRWSSCVGVSYGCWLMATAATTTITTTTSNFYLVFGHKDSQTVLAPHRQNGSPSEEESNNDQSTTTATTTRRTLRSGRRRTTSMGTGGGNSGPTTRIINGDQADPSQFPFVVVLNAEHNLKCAGSLISSDMVLTAAHCSESFSEVQVGRFNRSDDTELYDSLIVESIHTHPSYFRNRFLDPDPHDFAVVKLFGQASIPANSTTKESPIIRINPDDTIPTPQKVMHVAGWGAVDPMNWNQQSDVLRETDAYYIPTEECKSYVGTYKGQTIDFSKVVVDGATLCAMDFNGLSDSCRGDSGGPLVVKNEEQQTSVLVGLVSAGYGCANPTLPALYARVSHVYDWIRDKVCELSVDPPDDFNCPSIDGQAETDGSLVGSYPLQPCEHTQPRGTANDTTLQSGGTETGGNQNPPADIFGGCIDEGHGHSNIEWTNITLDLQLDSRPIERGWILRSFDDRRGLHVTVAERRIRSFADRVPWSIVTETITVPNNRDYQLVLLDSFGDGHDFFFPMDEDTTGMTPLIRVVGLDGVELLSATRFDNRDSSYFSIFDLTVGVPPTPSPSTTASPSESVSPSSAPTIVRPSISVKINFGVVPENIGFRLERLYDNDSLVSEERESPTEGEVSFSASSVSERAELLHIVYPGSFPSMLINGETTVNVPLDHLSQSPQVYRFTMTSNEGVGFTNGGSYEVWLDEPYDPRLLFEGGDEDDFYYEVSHVFVLDPIINNDEPPNDEPPTSGSQPLGGSVSTLWFFGLVLVWG